MLHGKTIAGTEEVAGRDPTQGRRRPSRLYALGELGRALANVHDVGSVFELTYREIAKVADVAGFIGGLYDSTSETIHVITHIDRGKAIPGGSFPLGNGFTSRVIRTRRPMLIRHWSREGPRVQVQYATDEPGLPESGMTVPLVAGEQVVGFLSAQSYLPAAYDHGDLDYFQALAMMASAAIGNLRLAQGAREETQRRVSELETVLASMSDGLLILDADGRLVELNRAARKLLCLDDASVVLGQPLDEERWGQWPLCSQAIAKALKPALDALRAGEPFSEKEVEVLTDRRVLLNLRATPLVASPEKRPGGIVVFRDVTSRREVERLKDEVLSIASHDLRTPVTAIKMQAQVMLRQIASGKATTDTVGSAFAAVNEQADRLVKLLNMLLDLSRLEAGRLEVERRPVDLTQIVRSTVATVQATAPEHAIKVEAPDSIVGEWDEARLTQVMQNLLTNAVKYSPNGGTVEVIVMKAAASVTVRVRDCGIGLAADDLLRVFARFYRAGNVHDLEGTGLGLYICKGIVTAHGGSIWAESPGVGMGSEFIFELPLQMASEGPAAGVVDPQTQSEVDSAERVSA